MSLGARIGKAHYYPLRSLTHSGLPWDICSGPQGQEKVNVNHQNPGRAPTFPSHYRAACLPILVLHPFMFFMCWLKFQPFFSLIFSMASPLAFLTLCFYSLTWFAHAPFSHFGTTEVMGRSPLSHRWWNRILLNHGHAFVSQGTSDEGFFTYIQVQSVNSPALFFRVYSFVVFWC